MNDPLFDLARSSVLVTGAGSGIGKAICTMLDARGARVLVTDVDPDAAAATAEELLPGGRCLGSMGLDVRDEAAAGDAVDAVVAAAGSLDVLVNNAGINFGNDVPAEALPLDTWQLVLGVNLTGPFVCSQAAARHMIPQGRGKIVNIASASAAILPRLDRRFITAYSVSKAGVVMLTRTLGLQWARYGITVNAISPTYTDAGLIQRDEVRMNQMIHSSPFERLGLTSDLEGAIVYLSSRASDFMTGQNLLVDGGFSL